MLIVLFYFCGQANGHLVGRANGRSVARVSVRTGLSLMQQKCYDSFLHFSSYLLQSSALVGYPAIHLCLNLSIHLCIYLSICLSVCMSVCLSVCLSACLPACLSVCLAVCLSICLGIYVSSKSQQKQARASKSKQKQAITTNLDRKALKQHSTRPLCYELGCKCGPKGHKDRMSIHFDVTLGGPGRPGAPQSSSETPPGTPQGAPRHLPDTMQQQEPPQMLEKHAK